MYDSRGRRNATARTSWFCSGPTMASLKARIAWMASTTSVSAGALLASLRGDARPVERAQQHAQSRGVASGRRVPAPGLFDRRHQRQVVGTQSSVLDLWFDCAVIGGTVVSGRAAPAAQGADAGRRSVGRAWPKGGSRAAPALPVPPAAQRRRRAAAVGRPGSAAPSGAWPVDLARQRQCMAREFGRGTDAGQGLAQAVAQQVQAHQRCSLQPRHAARLIGHRVTFQNGLGRLPHAQREAGSRSGRGSCRC